MNQLYINDNLIILKQLETISIDIQKRFWIKVNVSKPEDCWEWNAYCHPQGYGMFHFGKVIMAHRFAWMDTHGKIPEDMCVCHKCDNPSCCNPDHLFLGTQQENMTDMKNKGRGKGTKQEGALNHAVKLTEQQVIAIRNDNRKQKEIGREYGIPQQTVSDIKRRKSWNHI